MKAAFIAYNQAHVEEIENMEEVTCPHCQKEITLEWDDECSCGCGDHGCSDDCDCDDCNEDEEE